MTRQTKFLVYALGTALFAASLVYVGTEIARNWAAVSGTRIVNHSWVAASIALYAVSHLSTGVAWPITLLLIGERISISFGFRIGLVAQIGKYLPGNFAHYFGRGALARAAGITFRSSGLSTAVELVLAMAAAFIVALLMLFVDPRPLAFVPELTTRAQLFVLFALFAAMAFVAWIVTRGHGLLLVAGPAALLAISLLLSGLSLYALLASLGYPEASLAAVIGTFALAWAIGFIVPGAPAGIGIREAILITSLTAEVGPAPAVACAILHRLLTAGVDAALALIGYAWLASDNRSKM